MMSRFGDIDRSSLRPKGRGEELEPSLDGDQENGVFRTTMQSYVCDMRSNACRSSCNMCVIFVRF
jgi:hypothetical protein